MPVTYPTRFIPDPRVRGRFNGRLDRLASFLWVGDPLADDALEHWAAWSMPERLKSDSVRPPTPDAVRSAEAG